MKLFSFLFFSLHVFVFAEKVETVVFPLPMNIDGQAILSSLYIKCKMEDYSGKKIESFVAEENKVENNKYKEIFKDILNNDKASFVSKGSKWNKEVSSGETKRIDVNEKAELSERNLSGIRALKEKFEAQCTGFRIYKRILIGDGGMVVWGTDKDNGKGDSFSHRWFLGYQKDEKGNVIWDTSMENMYLIRCVIAKSLDLSAQELDKYRKNIAKNTPEFDYEIEIPDEGVGDPAYLLFNGHQYDQVDIITENVPKDDRILDFYQRAYRAWFNESTETFADYYTDNYKKSILDMMEDQKKSIMQYGRKVVFILDAKPFYVIFYKVGTSEKVLTDLVVEDTLGGDLKLAFWGGDFTSQYLASESFYKVLNKIDSVEFPIETE